MIIAIIQPFSFTAAPVLLRSDDLSYANLVSHLKLVSVCGFARAVSLETLNGYFYVMGVDLGCNSI